MKITFKNLIEMEKKLREKKTESLYVYVCEGFRQIGEGKKAHEICLEGLKKFPNSAPCHLVLAKILLHQEKFDLALDQLEQVIDLEPDNLSAYFIMGEIYLKSKKIKSALHCYKILLFYKPRDKKIINAVRSLESLTSKEYSKDVFVNYTHPGKIFVKTPTKEHILPFTDALMARGDYSEAQKLLEEALETLGSDPQILNRLNKIDDLNFTKHLAPTEKTQKSNLSNLTKKQKLKKMLEKLERK